MNNPRESFLGEIDDFLEKTNKQIYNSQKLMERRETVIDLIKKFSIKTIAEKSGETYIFDNGIYKPGLPLIKKEIQGRLELKATINLKNEILDQIKDLTTIERNEFEVNRNFINLRNGIYDLENRNLLSHNSSFLFLHQIPIIYDPSKDCPNIMNFLKQMLAEEDLFVMQEWFGFCLYRKYFIKKALILVGERDTGKTTLINLMINFIGSNNVSGISLQRVGSDTDRFSRAGLYQKHLNIYDDLSSRDLTDQGGFKIATGGGFISAEFKFGNPFIFENFAKLTFACNQIPSVKDTRDDAYFSRWIVIPFNNQIQNPDKFILQKLTTLDELSGLFNWALEGLYRLLENEEFSYRKDPDEIKMEMLRSGSVIANFVYDCCEREDEAWISKDELYSSFVNYAERKGKPIYSMDKFCKDLPKYANYLYDSKGQEGGKRSGGWRNVRLIGSNENTRDGENMSVTVLDV